MGGSVPAIFRPAEEMIPRGDQLYLALWRRRTRAAKMPFGGLGAAGQPSSGRIRKEVRRQQQRPHAGGPVRVEPPGDRDARDGTSLDGNCGEADSGRTDLMFT